MNPIRVIYEKEIREMFRDKRVRNSSFFGPLFMVVMLLCMFGFLIDAMSEPSKQKIHIVKTDNAMVQAMKLGKMDVQEVPTLEQGRAMVMAGTARLVVQFDPQFDEKLKNHVPMTVTALYNPSAEVSQIAFASFKQIFEKTADLARDQFLISKNIPPEQAVQLKLATQEVHVGTHKANDLLVGFLPYLIVIWAFYGGMSIVTELVAGEKEKNTLETLMITPAKRTQIALGKFFALSTVCLLSSSSAIIGVFVTAAAHLPITKKLFEQGVGLNLPAAGVIFVVMLPMVALFAGLMIAVSTYARNARESQSHLTLISFLVLMPAISSQFIGFTDAGSSSWINWVPILNSANTIRQAMFGKFDALGIAETVTVSLVLALIALRVAVALFDREEVLTRV